jgi:hypothetical protein
VRVRIDAVDKRIDLKRLTSRLAETYRPLLQGGQVHCTLNGHRLQPQPMPTLEHRDFRVRAGGVTLVGWVGLLPPGGAGIEPGMRCYRLGRLVAGGEWFGHPGPAQSPGLARLVGEVEIPRLPLTMNKSDFDRGDPSWRGVEQRLHQVLSPIVRRLSREEQPPPPASAVKAAEQVRKLLGQALRLLERNELFEGFEPIRGRTRAPVSQAQTPAQPELDLIGPAEETPDEAADETGAEAKSLGPPPAPPPRAPRRPPQPGDAVRRGVGRIELRALGDPVVRSLLLQEEGATVVVINTQHPLFEERRGDVWYQLETAVREITSHMEGVTLAEYERQVNRVMLLALGLRARRRRPRTPEPELRLGS